MNQQFLQDENNNDLLSHYRIAYDKYERKIAVPVIDVRDGITYRVMANNILRNSNRSKYMTYNQYHQSPKKQ